jgi:hypothetical protein
VTDSASAFAVRHERSSVPYVAELVRAIRSGTVALQHLSETVSSAELASIYLVRSSIAADKGQTEQARQFGSLAAACKANIPNPCALWLFTGEPFSYAAFEVLPSRVLAACFRAEGPFEFNPQPAA